MRIGRVLLGAVGLGVGFAAVWALREATLSTHDAVPAGAQTEVLVRADTHGGEPTQQLSEMVEAQVLTCRLEVNSDVVGVLRDEGDGRFSATLAPAMDHTNRRQFKGCLEDFIIDHVQIEVLRLENTVSG
ncbi:MAG TPA: hypothetical protein VG478_03090 [Acidimicrobiales bacterium]|jgi:hypothetical protein|nr:hypothetical protein [Acidimicrobiales bacterium]